MICAICFFHVRGVGFVAFGLPGDFFALRLGNFAVVWRKNRIFAGLKD